MRWSPETSLAFRSKNLWIVTLPTMAVVEATWTTPLNGLLAMVALTQKLIILTPVPQVLMAPATSPRLAYYLHNVVV